jgi:hypothetical protein
MILDLLNLQMHRSPAYRCGMVSAYAGLPRTPNLVVHSERENDWCEGYDDYTASYPVLISLPDPEEPSFEEMKRHVQRTTGN